MNLRYVLPLPVRRTVTGPVIDVRPRRTDPRSATITILDGCRGRCRPGADNLCPHTPVDVIETDVAEAPHRWVVDDLVYVEASTPEPVDVMDLPQHPDEVDLYVRHSAVL